MDEIFLTKESYKKLQEELKNLYKEKSDIDREIQDAKEQGDLSENAGYQYAKEKQIMLIKRISELENILRKGRIIDETEIKKDEVRIGAKIKILDINSNEEKNFHLVSGPEADPLNSKISVNSPLAQYLLGAKVNEIRKIKLPNGSVKEYKIISIEY